MTEQSDKPSVDGLMPCPFCGGAATYDHDDDGWNWIECSQCHVSTKAAVHAGEDCRPMLADAWHRRPSNKSVEGLMELVRDHGDYCRDELPESAAREFDAIRAYAERLAALAGPLEQPQEPRFFMDHGVWHDRVSGQHLYTDDQHTAAFNEVWQALEEAGIERNGWISIPEAIKKLATPEAEQPDSSYSTSRVGQINKTALPEDTRDAFEQWAEYEGYPTNKVPLATCSMGLPVYADTRTHAAWWAYQTAIETRVEPIAGPSSEPLSQNKPAASSESSVSVPKEQQ